MTNATKNQNENDERIAEMRDGRVIEYDTYHERMAKRDPFYDLAKNQLTDGTSEDRDTNS